MRSRPAAAPQFLWIIAETNCHNRGLTIPYNPNTDKGRIGLDRGIIGDHLDGEGSVRVGRRRRAATDGTPRLAPSGGERGAAAFDRPTLLRGAYL